LQDVCALLGEQAGKLRFLAGFQDQNAIAVQFVSHDLALTPIAFCLFIMTLGSGLAQGRRG
jgi:ABC-type oligopeptide transport system ATPase subunit